MTIRHYINCGGSNLTTPHERYSQKHEKCGVLRGLSGFCEVKLPEMALNPFIKPCTGDTPRSRKVWRFVAFCGRIGAVEAPSLFATPRAAKPAEAKKCAVLRRFVPFCAITVCPAPHRGHPQKPKSLRFFEVTSIVHIQLTKKAAASTCSTFRSGFCQFKLN